jgi:hypothetical protein
MKFPKSTARLFVTLLVGYVAGALLSGPIRIEGRTPGSQSVASRQDSREAVYFERERFELGMPKSEALARLAECCRMSGSKDSFTLISKHGPPFRMLGDIWFAEDKVSELRLHLDQFQEPESSKLGRLLFRRASEITHSEPGRAIIVTECRRNGRPYGQDIVSDIY